MPFSILFSSKKHISLWQAGLLLVATILSLSACNSNKKDAATGFTTEIPTYLGGIPDPFYQLAKKRQQQLGLDSLENGFLDSQIRVWYNFSQVKNGKLVVITKKSNNWTPSVYEWQVAGDGNTENILSKTTRQPSPASGWPAFSKELLDLRITELPNQDDVEGYSAGSGGTTYSVEFASKNQYRFFNYWEPQQYGERFWQAKNMSGMLKLFESELGM